ncbi:MAG: isocitrate lyase/phosphoenolpyruvate mutase family protein [Candidatus Velthaea sp.]
MTRCEILRRLHHAPPILLLPNCWDAASARVFEVAGFPAIATSSAAVAYALGYGDGQRFPLDDHFRVIENVVATVNVPVSVDFEAGYAGDDATLAANIRRLAATGAAGYNFEDALGEVELFPLDVQTRRVRVAKEAAPDLFLNARCDIFLGSIGPAESRLERTIERLDAYLQAGADGIFVPGLSDSETIATIATRFRKRPLNVLAGPALPAIAELERLGVARVSVGSWPMRRLLGVLRDIARELRRDGTFGFTRDPVVSYPDANALFAR